MSGKGKMPTKGKMTPTCAMCQQVGMSVRLCERHACLPELIEAARILCMNVDAMQLKPTIVSTAHLRRILARIEGEGA